MLFHSHTPRPPLDAFIADFWLYEDYVGAHLHERILPSGTFEMVFNLREDQLRIYDGSSPDDCRRFEGAVISGPYAGPFMSDTAEEAALLGVHFKPGGAFGVLGINAAEFTNAHVDLSSLWGVTGRLLREQLCTLSTHSARFQLLEDVLLKRVSERFTHHPAVRAGLDLLASTRGRAKVSDAAGLTALTQRRFTDLFTAEVGMTPKLFARIQRFQHAVSLSDSELGVDWAGVAARCGYFDQSHLIRDFVQFSGASPAEFRHRQEQLEQAGVHVKRHHLPLVG